MRWMAEKSHIAGTLENAALIRRLAEEVLPSTERFKQLTVQVLERSEDSLLLFHLQSLISSF